MAEQTKVNGVNVVKGNGLGPRTRIISLSKTGIATSAIADLNAVVTALTVGSAVVDGVAANDVVTIAGVAWVGADVVHLAVQGTGALTASADFLGVTGVTMAIVADFDQRVIA
jgi:hypothetical protein